MAEAEFEPMHFCRLLHLLTFPSQITPPHNRDSCHSLFSLLFSTTLESSPLTTRLHQTQVSSSLPHHHAAQ
jgi:hypothetical protein